MGGALRKDVGGVAARVLGTEGETEPHAPPANDWGRLSAHSAPAQQFASGCKPRLPTGSPSHPRHFATDTSNNTTRPVICGRRRKGAKRLCRGLEAAVAAMAECGYEEDLREDGVSRLGVGGGHRERHTSQRGEQGTMSSGLLSYPTLTTQPQAVDVATYHMPAFRMLQASGRADSSVCLGSVVGDCGTADGCSTSGGPVASLVSGLGGAWAVWPGGHWGPGGAMCMPSSGHLSRGGNGWEGG